MRLVVSISFGRDQRRGENEHQQKSEAVSSPVRHRSKCGTLEHSGDDCLENPSVKCCSWGCSEGWVTGGAMYACRIRKLAYHLLLGGWKRPRSRRVAPSSPSRVHHPHPCTHHYRPQPTLVNCTHSCNFTVLHTSDPNAHHGQHGGFDACRPHGFPKTPSRCRTYHAETSHFLHDIHATECGIVYGHALAS